MDAKYLRRFGVGGVVISKNLFNNILKELGRYLSCAIHVFTIPIYKKKMIIKNEFNNNNTAISIVLKKKQTIRSMRLFLYL